MPRPPPRHPPSFYGSDELLAGTSRSPLPCETTGSRHSVRLHPPCTFARLYTASALQRARRNACLHVCVPDSPSPRARTRCLPQHCPSSRSLTRSPAHSRRMFTDIRRPRRGRNAQTNGWAAEGQIRKVRTPAHRTCLEQETSQ